MDFTHETELDLCGNELIRNEFKMDIMIVDMAKQNRTHLLTIIFDRSFGRVIVYDYIYISWKLTDYF